jgi:hypothetical protein
LFADFTEIQVVLHKNLYKMVVGNKALAGSIEIFEERLQLLVQ